jgi:UDP-N-acetylmuramoylalanine--D-glutamate ligase
MTFREVICKEIAILGMARSGLAVAKLLKRHGAKIFLSDIKGEQELSESISELKKLGVEFETGGHTERVIEGKELIVLSPGIPLDLPILLEAKKRGLATLSEVEIASWFSEAHLVGITGSNGKTTTVSLLGKILKDAKREVSVCGNIGLPFSEVATTVSNSGHIVLELSSFQLERIEKLRPEVAAILNISPDHLDRHSDMPSYKRAKLRIFENQRPGDVAIMNADDLELSRGGEVVSPGRDLMIKEGVRTLFFSTKREVGEGAFLRDQKVILRTAERTEPIMPVFEIGIRGPHNLANVCAASCVASVLEVDSEHLRESLRSFKGVEHRLEKVLEVGGVRIVNDSKATNVDAVWYALQSVDAPILLIMGGKDKGGDFLRLKELVKKNVKKLILVGEAKEKIKKALGDSVSTKVAADMEEAVGLSRQLASEGDTVLLSPGCASFDMFDNYEQRGKVFKDLCREIFLAQRGSLGTRGEKAR